MVFWIFEFVSNGVEAYSKDEDIDTIDKAIAKHGGGAYTVMRTVNNINIVMPQIHAVRLGISLVLLESVVKKLYDINPWDAEQRITVIKFDRQNLLGVFHEPLPSVDSNRVIRVKMVKGTRHNPSQKTTNWIKERRKWDKEFFEECILIDEMGRIQEGLSSNVFIVDDLNRIHAVKPEKVLRGSIACLVGQCAVEHQIKIDYTDGLILDHHTTAMFITSTSRLVMAVNEVVLMDQSVIKLDPQNTVVLNMSEWVKEKIV